MRPLSSTFVRRHGITPKLFRDAMPWLDNNTGCCAALWFGQPSHYSKSRRVTRRHHARDFFWEAMGFSRVWECTLDGTVIKCFYWWGKPSKRGPSYTARIIALELAALMIEDLRKS